MTDTYGPPPPSCGMEMQVEGKQMGWSCIFNSLFPGVWLLPVRTRGDCEPYCPWGGACSSWGCELLQSLYEQLPPNLGTLAAWPGPGWAQYS
jgi:hypothetical protein